MLNSKILTNVAFSEQRVHCCSIIISVKKNHKTVLNTHIWVSNRHHKLSMSKTELLIISFQPAPLSLSYLNATLSFQLLRSKILESFLTLLIPHPISKPFLSAQPVKCIQNMIIPHHPQCYHCFLPGLLLTVS